jgi:hypothetical protein
MRRKIAIFSMLSALMPATLFAAVVLLVGNTSTPTMDQASPIPMRMTSGSKNTNIFVELPDDQKSVSGNPQIADARPVVVRKYLERWHSPFVGQADLIISASERYGVDPYLVVAIAQQESNVGKKDKPNCYNAWGWAQTSVYTRCFDSWEDGISSFVKEFAQNYVKKGLTTPEDIMTRYNATSPGGSWAKGVNQFLAELNNFSQ